MNCQNWEERIALYSGGDLTPPEAEAVERHLGECAGCQVFASGLLQTLEALKAAHPEEIAPAHYAAVRARVLAELRPRRRWGWVWAATTAIVLVAALGIRREAPLADLPVAAWQPPSAPAMGYVIPKVAAVQRPSPKPAPARKPGAREELLVKIETGDPDVVIYWITETKGDY